MIGMDITLIGANFSSPYQVCLFWNYHHSFADRDMAMRYHWGLGIGHAYSHGKEDHSQQSTTSPSTSGEKNPSDILTSAQENPSDISTSGEENSSDISTSGKENPSDISHTAQNPDEAPGNNVKEIEAEEEEQNESEGRLEVSSASQDTGGVGVGNAEEYDSYASATDSDESISDEEDEEILELYHTYQSEHAAEVVSWTSHYLISFVAPS